VLTTAALRFIKACFRTNNHFMNRHFVKSDLLNPMICLMEEESKRDNMLSSACMDILEIIRKVSSLVWMS
jgi:protein phosphatase-4 regulatory subunit 3